MDLDAIFASAALAATRWSVELRREEETVYRRDEAVLLQTASLPKVFLLVELAELIADGVVDPMAPLDRRDVAPVGDSGLWQHLATDVLPVRDVARLVAAVSDNLATNVLLDLVGLEATGRRAAQLAPGGSVLLDLVRDERGPEDPETLSRGCASDWTTVFSHLRHDAREGGSVGLAVLDWLSAGVDLSLVASAFGLDPLAHDRPRADEVLLWNKTGTDVGVRADAGVLEVDGTTWSYAVICNWEHRDFERRTAVLDAMRQLGSAIIWSS